MADLRNRLIGAWEMVDWGGWVGDTPVQVPLGSVEECGGILIYSENGLMTATLSRLDRTPFTTDSMDGGTPAEKQKAYETLICYAGEFEVDEVNSSVTHKVRYSSFPNWVGAELLRYCIFEGDVLKLDTPSMKINGKDTTSFISWRKVEA
ncbi:lipocalin-like domain-containing protein [Streptomyces sp. NPDC047081]|uniref:lipocalin-like domain-containing protein n=1 Tax=Streptomyces sp. NPDC047081 TaxID=3154706 RepID=UPI0033F6A725